MVADLLTLQANRNLAQADENTAACATLPDGRRVLCLRADWQTLARLDGIPGAEYSREWRCLTLPATREAALCVETIGRVRSATEGYRRLREELLTVPEGPAYPAAVPGQPQSYRHQREAFALGMQAFERGGGFGAFLDCGMGKTRLAIDLMRAIRCQLGLVVTPKACLIQWADQIAANWPEARVVPLVGRLVDRAAVLRTVGRDAGPTVILTNWEALSPLRNDLTALRFDLMVADEASRLLGRTTQMARAAFAVAKRSRMRLALTATPLNNDPTDLYALYHFINSDIFGRNRQQFLHRYFTLGGFTGKEFAGFRPEALPELVTRMYSCAVRTAMAAVADMPPILHETIRLDMSKEQRRLYEQLAKELYAEYEAEDGRVSRLEVQNVLAKAVRLQQLTAGIFPSSEEGECYPIDSAKTAWTCEYVRHLLDDTDQKIIIWTRFRAELARVVADLRSEGVEEQQIAQIDGATPQAARDDIRGRLNDRCSELRVLTMQIQTGSYGLDLPGADLMLFHSGSFSFQQWFQATRRGYRLGRQRPYQVLTLALRNTIDTRIVRVLRERQDLSEILLSEGFSRQCEEE